MIVKHLLNSRYIATTITVSPAVKSIETSKVPKPNYAQNFDEESWSNELTFRREFEPATNTDLSEFDISIFRRSFENYLQTCLDNFTLRIW